MQILSADVCRLWEKDPELVANKINLKHPKHCKEKEACSFALEHILCMCSGDYPILNLLSQAMLWGGDNSDWVNKGLGKGMIRRCVAEHGTRSTLPWAMCNQQIFELLEKGICFYIVEKIICVWRNVSIIIILQNKGIVELKTSQFGLVNGPV